MRFADRQGHDTTSHTQDKSFKTCFFCELQKNTWLSVNNSSTKSHFRISFRSINLAMNFNVIKTVSVSGTIKSGTFTVVRLNSWCLVGPGAQQSRFRHTSILVSVRDSSLSSSIPVMTLSSALQVWVHKLGSPWSTEMVCGKLNSENH